MGKAEFMTPKAIANRMKAKGLQKLRWFCQLCNKQCRDENGFKCHANSEGHKRQLALFASAPGKFLDTFSHEFEKTFLDELRRRYGSKRVHANMVYNEYIRDRNHTHMNATVWTTLSGFVRHLGRTGKCNIDETEKGWYIQYINRDPETLARQAALAKKEKMDVDDEERTRLQIEKRILELAKLGAEPTDEDGIKEEEGEGFDPEKPHEAIQFSLRPGVKMEPKPTLSEPTVPVPQEWTEESVKSEPAVKDEPKDDDEATREPATTTSTTTSTSTSSSSSAAPSPVPTPSPSDYKVGIRAVVKPVNPFELAAKQARENKEKENKEKQKEKTSNKRSAVEDLRESVERDREKRNRRDYWITPGVVVKIMNKNLADGKYYKAKGVIEEVFDKYVAQIKVLDFGDVLKLDQSHLETVIPQINGKVRIVNGAWRGETAVLLGLDVDNFAAKIKLASGPSSGKVIPGVAYEDICKVA